MGGSKSKNNLFSCEDLSNSDPLIDISKSEFFREHPGCCGVSFKVNLDYQKDLIRKLKIVSGFLYHHLNTKAAFQTFQGLFAKLSEKHGKITQKFLEDSSNINERIYQNEQEIIELKENFNNENSVLKRADLEIKIKYWNKNLENFLILKKSIESDFGQTFQYLELKYREIEQTYIKCRDYEKSIEILGNLLGVPSELYSMQFLEHSLSMIKDSFEITNKIYLESSIFFELLSFPTKKVDINKLIVLNESDLIIETSMQEEYRNIESNLLNSLAENTNSLNVLYSQSETIAYMFSLIEVIERNVITLFQEATRANLNHTEDYDGFYRTVGLKMNLPAAMIISPRMQDYWEDIDRLLVDQLSAICNIFNVLCRSVILEIHRLKNHSETFKIFAWNQNLQSINHNSIFSVPEIFKLSYCKIRRAIYVLELNLLNFAKEMNNSHIDAVYGSKSFNVSYTETETYQEPCSRTTTSTDSDGNTVTNTETYFETRTRDVTKWRTSIRFGITDIKLFAPKLILTDVSKEMSAVKTENVIMYEGIISNLNNEIAKIRDKIQEKTRIENRIKNLKAEKKTQKPDLIKKKKYDDPIFPNQKYYIIIDVFSQCYTVQKFKEVLEIFFQNLNIQRESCCKGKDKMWVRTQITKTEFFAEFWKILRENHGFKRNCCESSQEFVLRCSKIGVYDLIRVMCSEEIVAALKNPNNTQQRINNGKIEELFYDSLFVILKSSIDVLRIQNNIS